MKRGILCLLLSILIVRVVFAGNAPLDYRLQFFKDENQKKETLFKIPNELSWKELSFGLTNKENKSDLSRKKEGRFLILAGTFLVSIGIGLLFTPDLTTLKEDPSKKVSKKFRNVGAIFTTVGVGLMLLGFSISISGSDNGLCIHISF